MMTPDLHELLNLIEDSVHHNTTLPRHVLKAVVLVAVEQIEFANPQMTRKQAVEIFATKVKEKLSARKR
jgi:hypothetical protein